LSEPAPIGGPAPARPEVHAAIARAAQATGVDFSYLLGQARLESSLDPGAKAATSSAAGLYQFTSSTWLATLGKHGAEHGLGWAQDAERSQLLALRFNPDAAALMAAELASDNRAALLPTLGREPDAAELYLAHFLGAQGAGKFLTALAADPSQSAAALLPKAAEANRGVFFERSGAPRSLGEAMELMRGKLAGAMGTESLSPLMEGLGWGRSAFPNVAFADTPHPAALSPEGEWEKTRPSMAATLVATFGSTAEAMPAAVRNAYGKLKAFGL
jgi:hypothetical protein